MTAIIAWTKYLVLGWWWHTRLATFRLNRQLDRYLATQQEHARRHGCARPSRHP